MNKPIHLSGNIYFVEIGWPELKEGQIFISHVGDGEYSFNVFGSAFCDFTKFFKKIAEYFNADPNDIFIGHFTAQDWETKVWVENKDMIALFIKREHSQGVYYEEVARLTIAEVDPDNFPIKEEM